MTQPLKTNVRTIIERGTELRFDDIKRRGGTYAISYRPHGTGPITWGLVSFGQSEGEPILTYNLNCTHRWDYGMALTEGLHFYSATLVETEMVSNYRKIRKQEVKMLMLQAQVESFTESIWYRIARRLHTFFS